MNKANAIPPGSAVERLLPERAHQPLLATIPEGELAGFTRERLDARRVWYVGAKEVWG